MIEASDRNLVLRTRRGEIEAFGELVLRYQTTVFNVCYRLLGERRDAEDFTQEAFIRAYQRLETFDVEKSFGPWIRRVAANLCLNRLRRHHLVMFPLDDEHDLPLHSQAKDPEVIRIQEENTEDIHTAILHLPPHYRVVIELRHFHSLSYAEISTILKIPLSDVKSHLFRARKILARRFFANAMAKR